LHDAPPSPEVSSSGQKGFGLSPKTKTKTFQYIDVSDRKLGGSSKKPHVINKLNRHITIGQIDIDNDGVIGREELETFVAFYNSFVDDFQMQKRLLYFLCLAVIVSWAIIVGVLIPLNFLAVELSNDDNYQVVDGSGNALAIRQSVGVASSFACTHDYLSQLQYLFITDLHKEQVLSVQVLPRNAEDPNQSPFTEIAVVTTATGTYTIPCTTTAKRHDGSGDDNNKAAVKWNTSPNCGNGHVDSDEECDDDGDKCDANCLCSLGNTPFHGKCKTLCGNRVIDVTEHCDHDDDGCDNDHCRCKKGYTPIIVPITTTNGTNSTNNGTGGGIGTTYAGCTPINPCTFTNPPCGAFQDCAWDGHTGNGGVTCTCQAGFQSTTTHRGDIFCIDVDECAPSPPVCAPLNCGNLPGTYYCH